MNILSFSPLWRLVPFTSVVYCDSLLLNFEKLRLLDIVLRINYGGNLLQLIMWLGSGKMGYIRDWDGIGIKHFPEPLERNQNKAIFLR